jgi:hypothetical protein
MCRAVAVVLARLWEDDRGLVTVECLLLAGLALVCVGAGATWAWQTGTAALRHEGRALRALTNRPRARATRHLAVPREALLVEDAAADADRDWP